MKRIVHWLVPKKRKFFDMLSEESSSVFEAAKELKNFVNGYSKLERSERKTRAQSIKKFEDKVDELKQNIAREVNKNFATPIKKEDIFKMNALLAEIADLISTTASKFVVLSIERIDDYIIKLTDLVHSIVEELNNSIFEMKRLKNMERHCIKIFKLENEADDMYDKALADLFHYYKNSIDIIKYKEIYELLETTINKCRDTAEIIAKYS